MRTLISFLNNIGAFKMMNAPSFLPLGKVFFMWVAEPIRFPLPIILNLPSGFVALLCNGGVSGGSFQLKSYCTYSWCNFLFLEVSYLFVC